jgi:predicted nucleic acid-binding protein
VDVILDANAYIRVLHNHGRGFLQTNQFAELLTYLRRTSSRLVIPELTYNEVVARYEERLAEVAKDARDAWSTLKQVGMQDRIDFLGPNIKGELSALGELLRNPASGVQAVVYTDYSGVEVKEVARRGVGRVRPANDKGEELRDVILWLIVLHYAKQSKARIAFVSEDKTFHHTDETLHPTLQNDVEQAGVEEQPSGVNGVQHVSIADSRTWPRW